MVELLDKTHKKADGTFVDPRAARIKQRFDQRVTELSQSQAEAGSADPVELTQAQLDELYFEVRLLFCLFFLCLI